MGSIKFEKFKHRFFSELDAARSKSTISYLDGIRFGNVFWPIRQESTGFEEEDILQKMLLLYDDILSKQEQETKRKTSNGEDDEGNTDLDYLPEGYPFLKYCLKRAFLFNRPDYAIFYLLGEILGWKNSGRMSQEEFEDLYKILPQDFWERNRQELEYLNGVFDESKWEL